VDAGRVLLEAENSAVTGRDVTGHAELNLVRDAGPQLSVATLQGTTLCASTEPRAMCSLGSDELTAIVKDVAGISTRALSCREVFARGDREIDVSGPHLFDEAAAVHQGFWSGRSQLRGPSDATPSGVVRAHSRMRVAPWLGRFRSGRLSYVSEGSARSHDGSGNAVSLRLS
jgi:hypothetical protein